MYRYRSRAGFTVIELLVVIAVIGTLTAILFPVFSRAKAKARQTKCKSNLMQLVTALKEFRTNEGHYPPAPYYDHTADRWRGGFSALYPDYITDRHVLICPDDRDALDDSLDNCPCSYNGNVDWNDVDGDGNTDEFEPLTSGGDAILYNYHGYTYSCELLTDGDENCSLALGGYSSGYDAGASRAITPARIRGLDSPDLSWLDNYEADGSPGPNGIPDYLDAAGLSWQHFPGLANRSAPDNTIVTHCPHHRKYYKDPADEMDIIVTLGGQTSLVNVRELGNPNRTGVGNMCGWVHQNF